MNIFDIFDGILDRLEKEGDYVVEVGTDGSWSYLKMNGGLAVCWGQGGETTNSSGTEGGLYFRNVTKNFPSGLFVAAPVVFATTTGNWIGGVTNSRNITAAVWRGYIWASNNAAAAAALESAQLAIGKWK